MSYQRIVQSFAVCFLLMIAMTRAAQTAPNSDEGHQASSSNAATALSESRRRPIPARKVIVPGEDRFSPFAITIRRGQVVSWENRDSDDHSLTSIDSANTTGPQRLNVLLPGTEHNNGRPGTFAVRFNQPGTFLYYCRFHSRLNQYQQPVAPGPDGGIQDSNGNYGTPMMGIVTVRN